MGLRCPREICGHDNRDVAHYCAMCGMRISVAARSGRFESPANAAAWTRLSRGMSRKDVRELLGEPLATRSGSIEEEWFYSHDRSTVRSWLEFGPDGLLYRWEGPDLT